MMDTTAPDGAGDLEAALRRIDAGHREDPRGLAYAHSQAVCAWVDRLQPGASAALRVAARAQHLRRWQIPRDSYPPGRTGYLRWREDLQGFHARQADAILADCGCPARFIDRVCSIIRKTDPDDPETRTLEDALCLAFLERQLAAFSTRHPEPKLARILRRTWAKMSPAGRDAALGLALPENLRALLQRSLDGP